METLPYWVKGSSFLFKAAHRRHSCIHIRATGTSRTSKSGVREGFQSNRWIILLVLE
jgi:hypothetical protein